MSDDDNKARNIVIANLIVGDIIGRLRLIPEHDEQEFMHRVEARELTLTWWIADTLDKLDEEARESNA